MKKKFMALVAALGLTAKFEKKEMDDKDWQLISEKAKTESIDLEAMFAEAEKVPELEQKQKDALYALYGETTNADSSQASQQPIPDLVAGINDLKTKIEQQNIKIAELEKKPEPSTPMTTIVPEAKTKILVPVNSGKSNEKYLFSIESDFFSLDKPWNAVAAARKPLEVIGGKFMGKWEAYREDLMRAFQSYSVSFANRIEEMQQQGFPTKKMADLDYTGFDGTGWGEAYIVRRQDALIAYLRSLPSVSAIFPVQYNVQNKMVMTNSFLTDFSQAYQSGKVYKGAHSFEPIEAEVHDLMMKHLFENLKQLEKEYIGYLNREGSDPIKWTMIEWLMRQTLTKLYNEKEYRRINGVRVEPTTNVAGHFNYGSNGVLRRLQKYVDQFYLHPFMDLNTYTTTTILNHVKTFVEYVNQILPDGLRGYALYMNSKHIPWYKAAYRSEYGTDLDFKGAMLEVMDYDIQGIVPVPNMGNSCMMWIAQPGNIELYEDKAGEMANFYFERELESLIVACWFKEGAGAYMVGKKYTSRALLEASKRVNQYIFVTAPFTELDADATSADAADNTYFRTVANSGATDITNIANAVEGVVYRIECGSATNASTITKLGGRFTNIVSNWVPTAVGDYIDLYYVADGDDFFELERRVTS